MRHTILLFILFTSILAAQAQSKITDKPADFVADVKAMLVTGKASNADKLAADLESVWNSGILTSKQQKEVIDITQGLYRKRMRVNPHFEQFFIMITAGVNNHNMRGKQLDNMLEVVDKAVQNEDSKHLESFLSTASLYLKSNRIYQNSYYRLNASGGSFSFAYEGTSKFENNKAEDNWATSWDDEVNAKGEVIEDDGWGVIVPTPKKEDRKKAEKNRKESLKRQFIPAQPKVSGPVLKFENVSLTFVTPWDSTGIMNTHGQLMLASNMFVGEGGTFNWKADGAPASADIRKYNFNTSFGGFKAPDVTVSYPTVLTSPVDGALEWISGKRKTSEYPYPKFTSFTNDAKLKSLGANIAYTGGFSMQGNMIGSNPLDNSLSEIVVSQNGERKFRSQARNYIITDSLIMAHRASVAIYQQRDSLTHPAMQLLYSKPRQVLTLSKDKGPYARTPFHDTFHKLEISAEKLHWDLNSQDIDFSIINSKSLVPVQIESTHYYSNNRYQQLVSVAPFHPLQVLVGYATKAKSSTFYVSEVARATKLSEKSLQAASLTMQHAGYINYDPSSGYIEVKEKAWHYVQASRNTSDYDHLVIKSLVPSGRNATLNLADNKLTVRGVEKISFNNDTASVYIIPAKKEVHILKNRDIEFDGHVFASSLAFKGSKFKFNYDEFSIDLTKLDSVTLMSRKHRLQGGKATDQVLIGKDGEITGKLYINKPNNKSGKEYYADYPIFDAPIGAQVTFAKPDIAGGAYDNTVYFEMPPFKLDSLSSSKNVISFDGTFNSGGIFAPFKTKLLIMPDETLGFYYQPGAKGLAAFDGKGVVYDTVMMSSSGIQSKGRLTYLTATLHAPVFTYYKNAVVTKVGKTITIAEGTLGGTKFPLAKGADFHMNWLPQSDTMYLQTQKEPLKIYKEEFAFKGVAKLAPGGLYGSGVVDNPVANVSSAELHFKQRNLSGNNATLVAKSDVAGRPAIKAQGMAFEYDLVKGVVDFESEQKGAASIEFPKAQYKTSMSSARWDMNNQRVSLRADKSGNKNWFYSQHPQQEGLQFAAASGEYDLKANTILAGGVPYITVADAYIVPDSGKVAVAADATIKTLRNARIIVDTLQQYHKLYAGNIDILSRKAFKGTAVHDYFNAASDSFKLTFSNYVYGNPHQKKEPVFTFAAAQPDEKSQFYIFPRILYRGKVVMHAPKEHFDFDGDIKLNFTGNPADSDWFAYKKDSLNPTNVRIPITNQKAADGTRLYTGLHISKGNSKLYNTFVSKKQDEEDLDLFVVDGLLSYNKAKTEFKIGRENRAYKDSYEGNMLLYNEASNTIQFEGKLNLVKPVKNFKIEASGSGKANVDSSRYSLDAFMVFDLPAHINILKAMASSLKENTGGAGEALDKSDATLYKLAEFVGDKAVRQYSATMEYVPLPKLSSKLVRSLIINKGDLRWSNESKAWYSVGKLNVASILKEDINAELNGYLEIKQDMYGEPAVNLYLQANPYAWYYISFLENSLTIASTDEKMNKQVRSKGRGGLNEGSEIDKNTFLEHFRKSYLNGKDGFKIATSQPISEPASNIGYSDEEEETGKKKKRKKNIEEQL